MEVTCPSCETPNTLDEGASAPCSACGMQLHASLATGQQEAGDSMEVSFEPPSFPESSDAPTATAQEEGDSCLIDLRALARQSQPAIAPAPVQAAPETVDEEGLLNLGAAPADLHVSSFADPIAPQHETSSGRGLIYSMGGVVIVLLGVIAYLLASRTPAPPTAVAVAAEPQAVAAAPAVETGAAEAKPEPADKPEPEPRPAPETEPPVPPQPLAVAAAAVVAAEVAKDSPKPAMAPKPVAQVEKESRHKATKKTNAAKAKSSGSDPDASLDDMLSAAMRGKSARNTLPETPSRKAILSAMKRIKPKLKRCTGKSGTAKLNITLAGATGRVSSASLAAGPFNKTAQGRCILAAARGTRVPKFKKSSFNFTYPVRI